MVTDQQVRKLWQSMQRRRNLVMASLKAGMDRKTARKYVRLKKLPSQCSAPHTWRTREDPFDEIWPEAKEYLGTNPGLEAKTLFEHLQRKYPEKFADGQVRTFQRRVKQWRAIEGPRKEVFFPQTHVPGRVCESDFTHMSALGITIDKIPFPHLLYHFVLPYSNWEIGTICFGESYESLSEGLQNALWELGGVPEGHRTDRLSAAVHKECQRAEFTARYHGLLRHYGLRALVTQPAKAHEKGDVEQRHFRFKKAVNQALLLRGSREFENRQAYEEFLKGLFARLNAGRQKRFSEEIAVLKPLPASRLDDSKRLRVRVGPSSTIHVLHNTYSVDSRLIGEEVEVRISAEYLEVWYGQKQIERIPRLRGEAKHRIQYRHIIDWLVRKPGAFSQYRYRQDLFPATTFRLAYDRLRQQSPKTADRQYLEILHLAANESEQRVSQVLRELLDEGQVITPEDVRNRVTIVSPEQKVPNIREPHIDLADYDVFLTGKEAERCPV